MEVSARNSLKGTIKKIHAGAVNSEGHIRNCAWGGGNCNYYQGVSRASPTSRGKTSDRCD